ncbi:MAG: hypothetical protein ACRYG5_03330 [Janthinobacterium lividum]
MLVIEKVRDLADHVGKELGVSEWVLIEGRDKPAMVAEMLTMAPG